MYGNVRSKRPLPLHPRVIYWVLRGILLTAFLQLATLRFVPSTSKHCGSSSSSVKLIFNKLSYGPGFAGKRVEACSAILGTKLSELERTLCLAGARIVAAEARNVTPWRRTRNAWKNMWIIGGRLDYKEEAVFGYNISNQRDLLSRYYSHTLSLLAAEVRKVAILQNPQALFRLR